MILKPQSMFATPKSPEDLILRINNFTGEERTIAMTASSLTWNLACEIVNPEFEKALEYLDELAQLLPSEATTDVREFLDSFNEPHEEEQ